MFTIILCMLLTCGLLSGMLIGLSEQPVLHPLERLTILAGALACAVTSYVVLVQLLSVIQGG